MEYQNFWRPPIAVRHNSASQTVLPPPLKQQHQSLSAVARQRSSPAHEELSSSPAAIHGRTSDVPIFIPSDAESDGDDTEVAGFENDNERHIDILQCSRSDDTLPSIKEIAASIAEARGCGISIADRQDPRHEDAEPVNGDAVMATGAASIQRQPLPSQESGNRDDTVAIAPAASITSRPPSPPAMLCSPTPPAPNQPSDASQGLAEPTACEIKTTLATADEVPLTEPSNFPGLGSASRCSSRSSATSSNRTGSDERRRGSSTCTVATKPSSTDSCMSCDKDTRDGEAAESRDALDVGSSSDPVSGCDLASDPDSDSCPESGPSYDDDYSPSIAAHVDGEQEGECQANETDDDGDEPPHKRRRTRRSMPSRRMDYIGSASTSPVNAKPSTVNGHASTAVFHSPPPSQASIEGNEPDSAAFEEWNGTVKLITINGITSFEGQFEGELSSKILQALVQTWSAAQKRIRTPAGGKTDGVRRNVGPRGKFTPEEDGLIVELKTKLNLPWSDIHARFSNRFPGRSKGALQVRYCTKLKDSS